MIADGPTGVESLLGALLALAQKDEIRILVGHWDDPDLRYAIGYTLGQAASGTLAVRKARRALNARFPGRGVSDPRTEVNPLRTTCGHAACSQIHSPHCQILRFPRR